MNVMNQYNNIILEDKNTFVIGDIHGDINILKSYITSDEKIRNCNLIIAGDIGLGFGSFKKHIEEYKILNKWLTEKGINLYLLRGNHDDPSYFSENFINNSNVKTIQDYTVLTIKNTNILCVGGGISIDRTHRIKRYNQRLSFYIKQFEGVMTDAEILSKVNKGYWENEAPIYKEDALDEIKSNKIEISYVITHTSPHFAFKNDKNGIDYWLAIDFTLEDDLANERQVLTNIYNKVMADEHPLKEWIYGHFHEHNEEIHNEIVFTALANADYKWDVKEININ